MVLFLIAIKATVHSIQSECNQWFKVKWSEAIVNEIAIEWRGDMWVFTFMFGMRYSPNEIAIKWRGAICEFTLMLYEG